MKKTIATVALLVIAFAVQAQVTVKPGIRAGLNLSTFTNSDFDRKADFYVGGMVSVKLASFYTLQPEINYSRQGAKGVTFNDDINFDPIVSPYSYRDYDYEISYISLGLMNKFTFLDGLHAIVGPTLDFKVDDNFPSYYDDPVDVDVALNGGIGYTFPMGLTVEARYKLGLVDIFGYYEEDDYYDEDNNGNYDDVILNSVIQLGVSYSF
jgi:hypothetical protein